MPRRRVSPMPLADNIINGDPDVILNLSASCNFVKGRSSAEGVMWETRAVQLLR